jgi:DNA-directed RNA polymerase sigma subunit (sigma70/sigma32)
VEDLVSVSVNLEKALDKAYENESLTNLLDAPPSALAGLTPRHDEVLKEHFGIDTLRELGTNKYLATAALLAHLETRQG